MKSIIVFTIATVLVLLGLNTTQSSFSNLRIQESFCEDFIPVSFDSLTICVSADYYSKNGIRTPLGYSDALQLADSLEMWLPTPEMVDAIYQQADIKLAPIPMPPTDEMTTRAYYIQHHQLIEEQIADSGYTNTSGKLIAGHKKDVVAINRDSEKVAIYGWHLNDSTVIQPFSTVHRRDYFDYSHGIRLIKRKALDHNGISILLESPY